MISGLNSDSIGDSGKTHWQHYQKRRSYMSGAPLHRSSGWARHPSRDALLASGCTQGPSSASDALPPVTRLSCVPAPARADLGRTWTLPLAPLPRADTGRLALALKLAATALPSARLTPALEAGRSRGMGAASGESWSAAATTEARAIVPLLLETGRGPCDWAVRAERRGEPLAVPAENRPGGGGSELLSSSKPSRAYIASVAAAAAASASASRAAQRLATVPVD